ncbi:MAG: hypothetical protein PHU23_00345 [Dehalococcoidales bacterium]|nr:hypothetical protein [Dehalococcoidales bacterium]
MKPAELVVSLREVPETRLVLIELAWQIYQEVGSFDPAKVAMYHKEIEAAGSESAEYARKTQEMLLCLKELARSQP